MNRPEPTMQFESLKLPTRFPIETIPAMSDIIYPRSPRETMCGWMHLPRYIDKIRLYLVNRLHADYQPNFGKGFDDAWLKAAGVNHEAFIEIVRGSVCDGQVADWVAKNVMVSADDKQSHAANMLDYPKARDQAMNDRLIQRKEQAGLSHRREITTFVDFIDADEGRI